MCILGANMYIFGAIMDI